MLADYFSKFAVIRKLITTTSSNIRHHLRSTLAEHGTPEELVTDNGPQYSNHEFKKFCSERRIKPTTSSPLHPRKQWIQWANGANCEELTEKSGEAGEDPYIALLNYRITPVDSKLQAPAKLLNQRDYRTQLRSSERLQRLKTWRWRPLQLNREVPTWREQALDVSLNNRQNTKLLIGSRFS